MDANAASYSIPGNYKPGAIPLSLKILRDDKEARMKMGARTSNSPVQLVRLDEKKFVGVAATSSFQDVRGIGEASRMFMERKHEIPNIVDSAHYVCPHFANDVLFTYIYCMEVSELDVIPEGMIAFTVLAGRYARARSKDADPYALIQAYIRDNGLETNPNLVSFEVFAFGEEESKYNADIFVPVKDEPRI